MESKRIIAYLFGCAALAASLFVYLEYVYMLGFPDGHVTELGRAQRSLAYVFIAASVVFGLCFFYLGSVISRRRIDKQLSIVVALYVMSVVVVFLIDSYYRSHLMDGRGG